MLPTVPPPVDDVPGRLATLQAGLDLLDQGITVFDAQDRLVAWNQACLRLLDWPADRMQPGMPFETLRAWMRQHVDPAAPPPLVGPGAAHDLVCTGAQGRQLRWQGHSLADHGFISVLTDLTGPFLAEQQIRERTAELEVRVQERTRELARSESQLRLITDSIPALIAYFDAGRTYHYINRGYQDWFGLDPARPDAISARQYLGDETYDGIRHHVAQALGGQAVTFEYTIRQISGQRVLARTTLIPERSPGGEVVGCFELTFDITEQKRAQEMLVQAQKMEALGHLAGGLAHDFNNILTVVIGNLSALRDSRPQDPACEEFVEPAMEAARRGAELIRGLLSFSRQQPLAAGRVDVAEQIRSVTRLVRRSLPESLQLEFSVPADEPLWAWTDATRLQNSLLNLILNARDATAGLTSPATIRIRAGRTEQPASDRQPVPLSAGSYVRIDVADNGVGMDSETQSRVFEPFFTTKRPGLGTGLGLAMVHDFVRQSGGAVDVMSRPGEGTTISLWLPWDAGQACAASVSPAQHALPHRDRGVALLVEDEAAVRRVVRRQLLELGYAVVEAEDGLEAQTMLAGMPEVALLLTDIVMPGGVDGRDLARQARDQGQADRVALMSGYAPGELDCGGTPVIAKPFTRDALAQFLESLS